MSPLTLRAHFDGKHIRPDEPYELTSDTPITVTVFPTQAALERAEWERAASAGLSGAYCADEPDYTVTDVKR
jgi:hypothetical protein